MLGADFLFRTPKVGGAPKSGKMVKSISSFRFKLMFMVLLESVLQSKAKKSLGADFTVYFTVLNRCVNRIKYLMVLKIKKRLKDLLD